MAEAAAEALAERGVRDITMLNASVTDVSFIIAEIFRHRGLVIAAPTYSDGLFPPVAAVMDAIAVRGVKNREVALIGSYTWAPQAIKVMTQRIEACGLTNVAAPVSIKQSATGDDLTICREAAAILARKLTAE